MTIARLRSEARNCAILAHFGIRGVPFDTPNATPDSLGCDLPPSPGTGKNRASAYPGPGPSNGSSPTGTEIARCSVVSPARILYTLSSRSGRILDHFLDHHVASAHGMPHA